MALRKSKINEIPSGAVRLTEEEAFIYQMNAARKWKPQSEMWPLLYGSLGFGATVGLSGSIISNTFRRMLYLPKSSLFLISFPVITISALSATLVHLQFITKDIILANTPCPPCMQSRTALLMGLFGTVYPIIVCSAGNMLHANIAKTAYIPPPTKEPIKFFKTWQPLVQKNSNLFTRLLVINLVVAVVIAHMQLQSVYKLNHETQ